MSLHMGSMPNGDAIVPTMSSCWVIVIVWYYPENIYTTSYCLNAQQPRNLKQEILNP